LAPWCALRVSAYEWTPWAGAANDRGVRHGVARLFEPWCNRLVDARLQQMYSPTHRVPPADGRVAGAAADDYFLERDPPRFVREPERLLGRKTMEVEILTD
jgi:hypothetical protein